MWKIHCLLVQPDEGIVSQAAAARTSALERDLQQKVYELEGTSSQAEALASENTALREELTRTRDRLVALEQDHFSTQVPPCSLLQNATLHSCSPLQSCLTPCWKCLLSMLAAVLGLVKTLCSRCHTLLSLWQP